MKCFPVAELAKRGAFAPPESEAGATVTKGISQRAQGGAEVAGGRIAPKRRADAVDAAAKLGGKRHGPRQCSTAGGRSPACTGDPASIIVEDREIEGAARLVERTAVLEGPHRPMIASGFRERVGDGADAAGQVAAIVIIEAIDHP